MTTKDTHRRGDKVLIEKAFERIAAEHPLTSITRADIRQWLDLLRPLIEADRVKYAIDRERVEDFVAEVQAMNIPGLTINYEAPKAPLPTKRGVYADRQGDVWVISEDGETLKIVACAYERWNNWDDEPSPEGFAPFTLLVPKEES